ncbi:MAG TPA: 8-amino-7-oxononanoate synthase [Thermodesulfovibrionales bacterium]|nr:8-amino-7-oxononanoate synthase [Thermodesulfovibrionales bacterium]
MFSERLKELEMQRLRRSVKDRSDVQSSHICLDGRECINFGSNDYLGLSGNEDLCRAAEDAMKEFGFGSGASRLLAGGTVVHGRLEEEIARYKGSEAALLFNSGYSANTGTIPSISEAGDVIFSDELNHASIIDGCRLSKAATVIYRHRDIDDLDELMEREMLRNGKGKAGRFIVITDTVFSMDGDIAPLDRISEVCRRYNAVLYLDDAHGTGVLGSGKGALSHFGIAPEPWMIQMGTFSKALGSYGAFVAGTEDVIRWITNRARSFMFSTALPACIAAASLKALEILKGRPYLRERLLSNRDRLLKGLREAGYVTGSETPIIPLRLGEIDRTIAASEYLFSEGIYVPAIRPPTVRKPRLRITVTASHTDEDIDRLLEALGEAGKM